MINVQFLGLKKHFLVVELAEVYIFYFYLFVEVIDIFKFQVPVVVIFTKFDAFQDMCYGKLRNQGRSHEEASMQMQDLANNTFQQVYLPRILDAEFPPKAYVCLTGNNIFL